MNAIDEILRPYAEEGHSTMILSGRKLDDSESSQGNIKSLVLLLAERAKDLGMILVRYSLSTGIVIPYNLYNKEDQTTVKKAMSENGVTSSLRCTTGECSVTRELIDVLRGIHKLTGKEYYWEENKNKMKFLFLFEFSSHCIPCNETANNMIISELIYNLAVSKTFHDNGHLLICSDIIDGKTNPKIKVVMNQNYIKYPNIEDKSIFIKTLHDVYPKAKYEDGLDDSIVSNLSSNTPNRTLERMFWASHNNHLSIKQQSVIEQKIKDVETISEGTLTVLDCSRVANVNLVGTNVKVPLAYLNRQALGLRNGEKATATNIVLVGAPGTGKTDMALIVAQRAALPIFQLNSPKGSLVGETERLVALQLKTFSNITPSIAFMDEITESIPTQRQENLDAGASDAVLGAYLIFLSDNTREGKSLYVGISNCPYKICSALRDRLTFVPVIMPSENDIPEIIVILAKKQCNSNISPQDPIIIKTAKIFYKKHLMARRIRAVLKYTMQMSGHPLKSGDILQAAIDATPLDEQSWLSAIYADLWAISLTTSKTLLPWYNNPKYIFPGYIKDVLDDNCEIDTNKLNLKLKELRPYVNV